MVDDTLGDDDVVFADELECAEHGVERARAVVDKEALVALAVLEVVGHFLCRVGDAHLDIFVAKENGPAGDRVAQWLDVLRQRVPHPHDLPLDILGLGVVEGCPPRDLRRRVDMVEGARWADETLCAEEFFGVERAVWPAKLGVAFLWEVPERCVIRH